MPVYNKLDGIKLPVPLTVKHVGGGSSFIRTTAAGGTGKTPPGTGCNPGAVVRDMRGYLKDNSLYTLRLSTKRHVDRQQHAYKSDQP